MIIQLPKWSDGGLRLRYPFVKCMFGYHIITQQSWSHRRCSIMHATAVPGKKFINGILLDGLEQDMDISLGHCVPVSQNAYLICSLVKSV